jgi:hypothetical protein
MNQKPTALFRLDEQVFFTMAALCVLSIIVLAFRFTTRTPCKPVSINVLSAKLVAGELVQFKAAAFGVKSYHWNFGDGVEKAEITPTATHTYENAGVYTVTLTVNGNCYETELVSVEKSAINVNEGPAKIICPDTAYLDEIVEFNDGSRGAKSWEWAFEQNDGIDATSQNPTYTFTTPGPKTVSLRINGRSDLTASKTIIVIKRPIPESANTQAKRSRPRTRPDAMIVESGPTADPLPNPSDTVTNRPEPTPKVIAPAISTGELAEMFKQVMHGRKNDADFAIYFCNNDAAVTVTWGDKTMPFKEFCVRLNSLEKKNKIAISIPRITKDDSHCIKSMTAVIKRRNLLRRYETVNP